MQAIRRILSHALYATALALPLAGGAQAADAQRWDLRDLYATPADWDSAYAALRQRTETLDALKTTLPTSSAAMAEAMAAISDAQRTLGRLYVYASLKADEDLREPRAQERKQQAAQLFGLFSEKTSWLTPAIQALGPERARAFVAAEPVLKARFDLAIEDALRNLPHTLSPEGEALLAATRVVLGQPGSVFEVLSDAELPRPTIKLADGRAVTLSTDAYEKHRQSAVRADRKKVFDGFFGALKKAEGTFGANMTTQVLGDVFTARSRRFKGTLEAALFADNMPPAVYRTLVEQAHAGLPTLHRYLRLRQKMLGIQGPLAYYDNYPPMVLPPKGLVFDVERSKAITLQALAPMGDEYLGLLKRGFAATWTDSHPRPGKASGAYMAGYAYDVHPYVLLNHSDDFQSLSTLAHEWGHAVHTMLSKANQPFDKADYSTFIAESASIANEMLLSDYMVEKAATREEKLYYLTQALESIRTTFFRQVMFAEFQLAIHEEVEQGRPLSGARLSDLYCGLAKRFYGEAEGVMKIDPAYCVEWAYIGHFYNGYYVWQYATSMVGAAEFSSAIRSQGAPARERFVNLLKAGGSDYAYPLYVKAGVDLATAAPYQALMARMNRLLDEFERLAATPRR
ncbi:M3 family oligoendopeptidase [Rubrivivax sp. A210]|uniref:M3 family oligoendopeptidase n=1 Tax=Rubrivivax sp. A210 TaxID=2772301 RepID=UPI0019193A73|nr:M3 family oligoendopeptidase [Rubrivivax sp. A210]